MTTKNASETGPLNPLSSQTIRQFLTLRANREPKELKMNPASLEAEKTRQAKKNKKRNLKFNVNDHHADGANGSPKGQSISKGVKLDAFELTQVIGKGSFGKVVLVRKKDTGVLYAMKILNKENIIKRKQVVSIQSERERAEHCS